MPALKPTAIKLEPGLLAEAKAYAKATGRSFVGLVTVALKEFMSKYPAKS